MAELSNDETDDDDEAREPCTEPIVTTPEKIDLDWNNLKWENAVGKRRDCAQMIYTTDERQMYGKNRVLLSGETAYLCRLYQQKKCKSRLYMQDGRLYKKEGFIEHNHQTQDFEHSEFDIEKIIKDDCGSLDVLVNARSQSSAISEIFDKHMKK